MCSSMKVGSIFLYIEEIIICAKLFFEEEVAERLCEVQ